MKSISKTQRIVGILLSVFILYLALNFTPTRYSVPDYLLVDWLRQLSSDYWLVLFPVLSIVALFLTSSELSMGFSLHFWVLISGWWAVGGSWIIMWMLGGHFRDFYVFYFALTTLAYVLFDALVAVSKGNGVRTKHKKKQAIDDLHSGKSLKLLHNDSRYKSLSKDAQSYLNDLMSGDMNWFDFVNDFFERKQEQTPIDSRVMDRNMNDDNREYFKWLSLTEQHAYFDGMQEKLRAKFNHAISERYGEGFIPLLIDEKFYGGPRGTGLALKYRSYINQRFGEESSDIHGLLVDYGLIYTKNNSLDAWFSQMRNNLYPSFDYFANLLESDFIQRKFNIVDVGLEGEKRVMKELDQFDERYTVLDRINVKVDGDPAESDAIVLSHHGIFTLEVKNFAADGQYSIHISKDGQWTRTYADGTTDLMDDVVTQNNRHVRIKQRLLNTEMRKRNLLSEDDFIDINGLIVIGNDVVKIENESDFPVLRISRIYDYIRQHKQVTYTNEQINAMSEILVEHNRGETRFPEKDLEKEFDTHLAFLLENLKEYDRFLDHMDLPARIDAEGKWTDEISPDASLNDMVQ